MKNHKYIHKKSQAQEKRLAKEFGGRTQLGSGNIESVGMKGDIRMGDTSPSFNTEDFLIEAKFTDSPKYKLEVKTWQKIEKEALRDNMRTPMMQIDIQEVELIVMSLNDYQGMYGELEGDYDTILTEAKTHSLDGAKIYANLDIFLNYKQKLTFIGNNVTLVIMGKDDFFRFTK